MSGDGVLLEANKAFLQLMGLDDITLTDNQSLEYAQILSKLQYSGSLHKETIINSNGASQNDYIIDGLMEDISLLKQREAEREAVMTELAVAKEVRWRRARSKFSTRCLND